MGSEVMKGVNTGVARTASRSALQRARGFGWVGLTILVGVLAAVAPHLISRAAPRREAPVNIGSAVGMPGAPPTSPTGLVQRISDMEGRLRTQPHDTGAAVLLADALLRQARATNDLRP